MPTHGQDSAFVEELSTLSQCLDELGDLHPNAALFLRGDFNVSERNDKRTVLLNHFSSKFNLAQSELQHKTYHHFTGAGKSDSSLDKIFYSKSLQFPEIIQKIHCKLSDPAVDSHHDLIVSNWSLPDLPPQEPSDDNVVAPRVPNTRSKVLWSDSGVENFQQYVVPELERIQQPTIFFQQELNIQTK